MLAQPGVVVVELVVVVGIDVVEVCGGVVVVIVAKSPRIQYDVLSHRFVQSLPMLGYVGQRI
jgi:hypothetical protein